MLRNLTVAADRNAHVAAGRNGIVDLSEHVATLHLSALVSPGGRSAASTILRYYEQLSARRFSESSLASYAVLPKPPLVSLLAFSLEPDSLSRISSVVAGYKKLLESNLTSQIFVSQTVTDQFNGYVLDLVGLIWRSRALSADSRSLGAIFHESLLGPLRSYLSEVDGEYNLASIFGLSHNSAISSMSLKAFQELEERAETEADRELPRHVGPVSQRSLVALGKEGGLNVSWKEYRLRVLDWLEKRGMSGIKELMYVTVKDLRAGAA